jgi:hypothetical protein
VNADKVVDRVGWNHVLRERGADLSVGEGHGPPSVRRGAG